MRIGPAEVKSNSPKKTYTRISRKERQQLLPEDAYDHVLMESNWSERTRKQLINDCLEKLPLSEVDKFAYENGTGQMRFVSRLDRRITYWVKLNFFKRTINPITKQTTVYRLDFRRKARGKVILPGAQK
jgi:hypothetical protein